MSNFPPTERLWWVLWSKEDLENKLFDLDITNDVFSNLTHLMRENKLPSVSHYGDSENCDYSTTVNNCKNIYLCSNLTGCENVFYSYSIKYSSDIYNSVMVWDNASCVSDSFAIFRSHEVFYSSNISNSEQIWFCSNLVGCRECINCEWLEHASFYIDNVWYEESEYFALKKKILSSKEKFERKIGAELMWYVPFTEQVENGFATSYLKEWRNVWFGGNPNGAERYYDAFSVGRWEDMYGWVNSWWSFSHIYCCYNIWRTMNAFYSMHLQACSYCFGCIWLKNKSYCIYNKQYTKEEWHDAVDTIFTQMEKEWTLGNFFPGSMSPFYFNDTAAYLIDDSFTKEEVQKDWYLWRDEKIAVDIPETMEIVKTDELHQYESREGEQRTINPEILKKVIQDEEGNIYKILKMEVDFHTKYWLPLPRKHWLERLKQNFSIW